MGSRWGGDNSDRSRDGNIDGEGIGGGEMKNKSTSNLLFILSLAGMVGLTYAIYELSKLSKIDDIFEVDVDDEN